MLLLLNEQPELPLILCEYSHSMGCSTGNLQEYWDFFRSHPRCQGGFGEIYDNGIFNASQRLSQRVILTLDICP